MTAKGIHSISLRSTPEFRFDFAFAYFNPELSVHLMLYSTLGGAYGNGGGDWSGYR